jgi:hypothetical protein
MSEAAGSLSDVGQSERSQGTFARWLGIGLEATAGWGAVVLLEDARDAVRVVDERAPHLVPEGRGRADVVADRLSDV